MLALIKWSVILAFSLVLIVLCVVNRHAMGINLYPLPYEISLPVYLFAAIFFLCGFLMAALAGGLRRTGQTLRLRNSRRRIDALENEVAGLRHSGSKTIQKS